MINGIMNMCTNPKFEIPTHLPPVSEQLNNIYDTDFPP